MHDAVLVHTHGWYDLGILKGDGKRGLSKYQSNNLYQTLEGMVWFALSNFQALSSWFSHVDFYLWWLFNWTGRAVSPYGRRWARWPFLFPAELISTHLKSLVNISPLDSQQIGPPPLPLVRIRHSLACPAHAKWCGSDDDQGKSRIRWVDDLKKISRKHLWQSTMRSRRQSENQSGFTFAIVPFQEGHWCLAVQKAKHTKNSRPRGIIYWT